MKSTVLVVAVCALLVVPAVATATPLTFHLPGLGDLISSIWATVHHPAPAATQSKPQSKQRGHHFLVTCPAGSTLDPNGNCVGG
jgi:hypothetical protein